MTDPTYPDFSGVPDEPPYSPAYHPPASPYAGPPAGVAPYSGPPAPYSGPPAPFGAPLGPAFAAGPGGMVDPITGQPLSDKTRAAAGLLQLLPGLLLSVGGIGRLYAGNTTLGVIQLVATLVGWTSFVCGFFLVVPWIVSGGIWLWFVIDGVLLLAGRPRDGQGRLLR